jgi:hypothetical protein
LIGLCRAAYSSFSDGNETPVSQDAKRVLDLLSQTTDLTAG